MSILCYSPWDRSIRPVHSARFLPYLGAGVLVTETIKDSCLRPKGAFHLISISGLQDVTSFSMGTYDAVYRNKAPESTVHFDTIFPDPFTMGIDFHFQYRDGDHTTPQVTYRYYEWTEANRWLQPIHSYMPTTDGEIIQMFHGDVRRWPEVFEVDYGATITDTDVAIPPVTTHTVRIYSSQECLKQLQAQCPTQYGSTDMIIMHSDPPCVQYCILAEHVDAFKALANQLCPGATIGSAPLYHFTEAQEQQHDYLAYLRTELTMQQARFLRGERDTLPLTVDDIKRMKRAEFPSDEVYAYYLTACGK